MDQEFQVQDDFRNARAFKACLLNQYSLQLSPHLPTVFVRENRAKISAWLKKSGMCPGHQSFHFFQLL